MQTLKEELSAVPYRVIDRQPPERQTAFGLPTIHQQCERQKRKLRARAGAPNEKLTSGTGEPLVHTREIENEVLLNKNNPLQYCLKMHA